MTHLESIPSTIHQTLVEGNSICTESQIGDSVNLLYKCYIPFKIRFMGTCSNQIKLDICLFMVENQSRDYKT